MERERKRKRKNSIDASYMVDTQYSDITSMQTKPNGLE